MAKLTGSMRMKRLKKGHLVKNDALLRWLVGWFLFFSILVPQKVPRSLPVRWYTNKGHDVVKKSQFLHDVTASAACQTCHPVGTRCLSARQRQQTYIHTHTRAYTVTHTLSNDSANSHDRKTRTQTIKSLFVPAWGGWPCWQPALLSNTFPSSFFP